MIKKKICMLGVFAVGKTSLVQRFVKSIFSDKYLTTVGVKIDKKTIDLGGTTVDLMLWDLQGEDEFQELQVSYLRGTSGYLLVADGTRAFSFDRALLLKEKVDKVVGDVPFVMLINKADLTDQWELDDAKVEEALAMNWHVMKTSAKTGENVEEAFQTITMMTMEQ
jgi:small GTP-binding protein